MNAFAPVISKVNTHNSIERAMRIDFARVREDHSGRWVAQACSHSARNCVSRA